MKKGLKRVRVRCKPNPYRCVGSIALMKKGLKPRLQRTPRLSTVHSWKYCPDEEGIETERLLVHRLNFQLRWKYCPDEEGIETLYISPFHRPLGSVGSIALMKKGLKRLVAVRTVHIASML